MHAAADPEREQLSCRPMCIKQPFQPHSVIISVTIIQMITEIKVYSSDVNIDVHGSDKNRRNHVFQSNLILQIKYVLIA